MSESKGKTPEAKSEDGKIAVWESDNQRYFSVVKDEGEDVKLRFSMNASYFDAVKFSARDVVDMTEGNDVKFSDMPTRDKSNTYPVAFFISGFTSEKNGEYTNHYARVEKAPLIMKEDRHIGYRLPVEGCDKPVSFMCRHKIGDEWYELTARDCYIVAKDKEIQRGGFTFKFEGVEDHGNFTSAEVQVSRGSHESRSVSM